MLHQHGRSLCLMRFQDPVYFQLVFVLRGDPVALHFYGRIHLLNKFPENLVLLIQLAIGYQFKFMILLIPGIV